ncbi:MAG: hypothetical protein V9H26_10140 [Verrucomicrobiota bacterium]
MKALIETRDTRTERVFLVGLELKSGTTANLRESLDELAELATTAGGEVIGEGTQKVETPNPATYIGKGKAGEYRRVLQRERRGHGHLRRRAFPGADAQPGKDF